MFAILITPDEAVIFKYVIKLSLEKIRFSDWFFSLLLWLELKTAIVCRLKH